MTTADHVASKRKHNEVTSSTITTSSGGDALLDDEIHHVDYGDDGDTGGEPASKSARTIAKPASGCTLVVTNFVRPLTIGQVRELASHHGELVELTMNDIKSTATIVMATPADVRRRRRRRHCVDEKCLSHSMRRQRHAGRELSRRSARPEVARALKAHARRDAHRRACAGVDERDDRADDGDDDTSTSVHR